MCIVTICRICGDKFPAIDLRKTVCDKESCRVMVKREKGVRKHELICEWCGNIIPIGGGRKKFCTEECAYAHKLKRNREYHSDNRLQVNYNQRIRRNKKMADKTKS